MSLKSKLTESWTYKKYHRRLKIVLAKQFYNNAHQLPEGIDRVYHVHIRKSAGTSINSAFWGLEGYNLDKVRREPIVLGKKKSFVRYDKRLIEEGHYFHASSHFPLWQLDLKPKTFMFTMLREPYERLVSLYKYYNWVNQVDDVEGYKQDPSYFVLKKQLGLLGNSFTDFLNNLNNKYLFNQLFMFSEQLDVDEALSKISKLDRVYFKDNFNYAIKDLSTTLNINLQNRNERAFKSVNFNINESEAEYAKDLLKKEYQFYNELRNIYKK